MTKKNLISDGIFRIRSIGLYISWLMNAYPGCHNDSMLYFSG